MRGRVGRPERAEDEWVQVLTDWVDAAGEQGRTGTDLAHRCKMHTAKRAWTWMVRTGIVRCSLVLTTFVWRLT